MKGRTNLVAVVLVAIAVVSAGLLGSGRAEQAPPSKALLTNTFVAIAESVKPAVINVATVSRVGGGRTAPEESFGEEFFHRFFGEGGPERTPQHSLGSGVIVDPSGIALTNAHVVEKATQIDVTTLDGTRHRAKIAGIDTKSDLAVLRLDDGKGKFPAVKLGDSDKMQVGDWVLAVGSPFGLQATVTAGIISATARHIGEGGFDEFLQTDAAINPGNSGGPLVNMSGEVVGINTAIVAGGSGIGFAIPSSLAKRVYTELLTKGKVTRGWLGVSIQELTPELAKSFGLKDTKGVLIAQVQPGSPAEHAGLKSGDVIVGFDGKKVEQPADLQRAVAFAAPGHGSHLSVWRDGAERTLDVKLGEAPEERTAARRTPATPKPTRLGLAVQAITPEIARQLHLSSTKGVVVAHVEDGSGAADAGVQPGDVIEQVNRQPVTNVADFERLTSGVKPGDVVALLVHRGQAAQYLAFTVGEPGGGPGKEGSK